MDITIGPNWCKSNGNQIMVLAQLDGRLNEFETKWLLDQMVVRPNECYTKWF